MGRRTGRFWPDAGGWRSGPPERYAGAPGVASGAGNRGGSDAPAPPGDCRPPVKAAATRWDFMAEGRVDESARPRPRARRPGRATAHTPGTAKMASTASMATTPCTATPRAGRLARAGPNGAADRMARRTGLTRRWVPAGRHELARGRHSAPGTGSAMGRSAGRWGGELPPTRKGTRGIFSGRRDRGSGGCLGSCGYHEVRACSTSRTCYRLH